MLLLSTPSMSMAWTLLLVLGGDPAAQGRKPPSRMVGPPPSSLVERASLDAFYSKHVDASGLPVLGSERVSDEALLEASHLIDRMLDGRDDIREAMARSGLRVVVMAPTELTTDIPEHRHMEPKAYWDKRARGLGPGKEGNIVTCGEENLLGLRGDPYASESIFVHEFAHAVHERGLRHLDPSFDDRLRSVFVTGRKAGRWAGTYAGTNERELWAEAVQSWFDTNRQNDGQHNDVDTRVELKAYDAPLAALVKEVFGDGRWRFSKAATRKGRAHLVGFDVSRRAPFAWPAETLKAYDDHVRGAGLEPVTFLPLAQLGKARSPTSSRSTSFRVINLRDAEVVLLWLDAQGHRREYARVPAGGFAQQATYVGHLWLVASPQGEPIVWFSATAHPSVARIR